MQGIYYENHHIIPSCLGGTEFNENKVLLTADEHYVAHQLLIKMHPTNHKLIFAANMMTVANGNQIRNNKQFKWIKEAAAKAHSERIVTAETKERMRQSHLNSTFTFSAEQKAEMSRTRKGHNHNTADVRKKIGDAHRGKIVSEETRKKLSVAAIGKTWKDNAARVKKMVDRQTGTTHSVERCNKMSESMKGKNTPYEYLINSVLYTSVTDIVAKYSIHRDTVRQRCQKDTFPEWIQRLK